ncbi:diguanylate cyclase response regulator [Paramagnetospirillum marisnigri]|uniref:diguanylate cyclase n=1 Tax=Paramagnetospirillum marisnigri TaxID=1285242 RepID=A0A178MUM0_9PROT|nr:GGDEF domain-containing response regulator [Paramagnetospirillum marisnigri]OAN53701.1 diguanylate cyclase response regulator [Paramagnetospirillum marisnigri]
MPNKQHALLVEDSPTQALLTLAELEKLPDVKVEHAASLAAALEAIAKTRFDVVFLDLTLPDSVGDETVKRFCGAAPELAVVVLTNHDDDAQALQSLEQGAQDYMLKARIDAPSLSRSLRYSIQRKRAEILVREARDEALEANRQLERRMRQINCLYGVSRALESHELPLKVAMEEVVGIIPSAWLRPETIGVRLTCHNGLLPGGFVETPDFVETPWRLEAQVFAGSRPAGRMEICWPESRPAEGSQAFAVSERELVRELARRVGQALERACVQKELVQLATIDFLTEALNRRHFMQMVGSEIQRATRYGRPLSVLMLDIDHFKRINDDRGHAAGDEALKAFVILCRDVLRDQDIIGRLGGEEFAIALPETGLASAEVVAGRVRAHLAEMEIPLSGGDPLHLTTSIGVAECKVKEGEGLEACLGRADAALYRAKAQGRDRVEAAE